MLYFVEECCLNNTDRAYEFLITQPGLNVEDVFIRYMSYFEISTPDLSRLLFVCKGRKQAFLGIGKSSGSAGFSLTCVPFEPVRAENRSGFSPLVLLETSNDMFPRIRVSINGHSDEELNQARKICKLLEQVTSSPPADYPPTPACVAFRDVGMSFPEYSEAVNLAIRDMQTGSLNKVVYSRCAEYTHLSPVSPASLLAQVVNQTRDSDSDKRYIIYFKDQDDDETYISVTPETLCRVHGNVIETEALAGTFKNDTAPVSISHIDDKINTEHSSVSSYIQDKLSVLGDNLCVSPPSLLRLSKMTHVVQSICQTCSKLSGQSLVDWVLDNLNPTPAVCGTPLELARKLIGRNEKFKRGFFSAPIGVTFGENADIAVGLRCAVVTGNVVKLYAGAGIVIGSDPVEEWKEMDLKMSQFSSILLGEVEQNVRPISKILSPGSSFPSNATEALSAFVVEELVRQQVTDFIICPGSRSTPLTTAAHRHPNTTTYVIHDERSAGFYAVGLARSSGRVPAIIVTSGTAVANLLPAVCEAREARVPLICLTADRPSDSWNVGEYQTIKQDGIFSNFVGFEKSIPPVNSESPKIFVSRTIRSVLADVSFSAGEIATNRRQIVHLNFEFHKQELQPVEIECGWSESFSKLIANDQKLVRYCCNSKEKYTNHIQRMGVSSSITRPSPTLSIHPKSTLIICGELRIDSEATALLNFINKFNFACIADITSMMSCTRNIFMGIDQLMGNEKFTSILDNQFHTIIRVGGPLISARIQNWSSLPIGHRRVIRVLDDYAQPTRHDPQHTADEYYHVDLEHFLEMVSDDLISGNENLSDQAMFDDLPLQIREVYCEALDEVQPEFNEMNIARHVSMCSLDRGIFLSSSMPCRDFDIFGPIQNGKLRHVGCNRGANGIDGVIASALGYSRGLNKEVLLMIGDVATLHDIGSITLALNKYPGFSPPSPLGNLKIVCINNSGGCIFSFLPIRNHQEIFDPYFNTPHGLKFSPIVNAMSEGVAAVVQSIKELREALNNPEIRFIECFGLPDHDTNVVLHKQIGQLVASRLGFI